MPAWLGSGFWEGGAPPQGTFAESFGSSWTSSLGHIRLARYIAQWNAFTDGESGEVSNRHVFEGWLKDAAYYGLTLDLSLTNYIEEGHTQAAQHMPKSVGEYETNLIEFLKWAQGIDPIRYVEAWNEPNAQGAMKGELSYEGKTWTAPTAAEYTNAATKVCESYGCTVIAANLYDGGAGAVKYEEEYEKVLTKAPAIWGVHPYWSVQHMSESYVVKLEEAAKRPAHVWFTEVGAYYCYKEGNTMVVNGEAGQAERAESLTRTIIPKIKPEHTFYYQADNTTGKSTCSEGTPETALFMGSGAGFQPRLAASYIWANERMPWGFTGDSATVSGSSATLNGTVYPEGSAAKYHFEYGTTTSYGSYSGEGSVGSGETSKEVAQSISGLTSNETYHYRIVSWSKAGHDTYGVDRTFVAGAETRSRSIETATKELMFFTTNASGELLEHYRESGGAWKVVNITSIANGSPHIAGVPAPFQTASGELVVFARGSSSGATGELLQFYREAGGGWKVISVTSSANGTPWIGGDPAPIQTASGELAVFARASGGELLQFYREAGGGWKVVNITSIANGNPYIAGVPAPFQTASGELAVFARASGGELLQFYREAGGGWKVVNITSIANGNPYIAGVPAPFQTASGELAVFARGSSSGATGELLQFYREAGGGWKVISVTSSANGTPWIGGDPAPFQTASGELVVFARGSSSGATGELLQFYREAGGGWKVISVTSSANGTPWIGGDPAPIQTASGELAVFAYGTSGQALQYYRESGGGWKDLTI